MRRHPVRRWDEPESLGSDPVAVEVYRNLRTGTWSVRCRGVVIERPAEVWLRDCTLVVQPAGRRKVIRTRQKNVHAFVRGFLCDPPDESQVMIPITYNPYIDEEFVTVVDRDPVREARWIHLRADMTAWMALVASPHLPSRAD